MDVESHEISAQGLKLALVLLVCVPVDEVVGNGIIAMGMYDAHHVIMGSSQEPDLPWPCSHARALGTAGVESLNAVLIVTQKNELPVLPIKKSAPRA